MCNVDVDNALTLTTLNHVSAARLVHCHLPHLQDEVQVEQDKERIVRMANILGFAVVSDTPCTV